LSGLFEGFARAAAGQTALERLLVMAQRYRKEGNLREAMELFWTLVQDHPKTLQAASAKSELLALAESYERAGNQHIARGMYERLLDLED
jgi:TolA-binding protein